LSISIDFSGPLHLFSNIAGKNGGRASDIFTCLQDTKKYSVKILVKPLCNDSPAGL
jgi:hypothetical protein